MNRPIPTNLVSSSKDGARILQGLKGLMSLDALGGDVADPRSLRVEGGHELTAPTSHNEYLAMMVEEGSCCEQGKVVVQALLEGIGKGIVGFPDKLMAQGKICAREVEKFLRERNALPANESLAQSTLTMLESVMENPIKPDYFTANGTVKVRAVARDLKDRGVPTSNNNPTEGRQAEKAVRALLEGRGTDEDGLPIGLVFQDGRLNASGIQRVLAARGSHVTLARIKKLVKTVNRTKDKQMNEPALDRVLRELIELGEKWGNTSPDPIARESIAVRSLSLARIVVRKEIMEGRGLNPVPRSGQVKTTLDEAIDLAQHEREHLCDAYVITNLAVALSEYSKNGGSSLPLGIRATHAALMLFPRDTVQWHLARLQLGFIARTVSGDDAYIAELQEIRQSLTEADLETSEAIRLCHQGHLQVTAEELDAWVLYNEANTRLGRVCTGDSADPQRDYDTSMEIEGELYARPSAASDARLLRAQRLAVGRSGLVEDPDAEKASSDFWADELPADAQSLLNLVVEVLEEKKHVALVEEAARQVHSELRSSK